MTEVTILEGERVVWKGGQFVPGASGITSASRADNKFTFEVGSGRYQFKLIGE